MTGWKYYLLILFSVAFLVALPYIFLSINSGSDNLNNQFRTETGNVFWGVNAANLTTEELYQCVTKHYGTPTIWGRYLGDKENISVGLTHDELDYLHAKNIKALLIYNQFTDATGYEKGKQEATNAISLAQELNVPIGKAIFAEIQPFYPIDDKFLDGWFEVLNLSDYTPAIYGTFAPGHELDKMYRRLANRNEDFKKYTILWTAYPQQGTTTKSEAPHYNSTTPDEAIGLGWQYGIDGESCKIDTNLYKEDIIDYVW